MWRTIMELSLAGFKIDFSPFFWTYATGYPKAHNIGKALKKKGQTESQFAGAYAGCQPKPAVEVILVAMKPLTEKTYEAQRKPMVMGLLGWMTVAFRIADRATLPRVIRSRSLSTEQKRSEQ